VVGRGGEWKRRGGVDPSDSGDRGQSGIDLVAGAKCFVPIQVGIADWISCRRDFFLPVRVLSRLFRRLFLKMLKTAHAAGRLSFYGAHSPLAERQAFAAYLRPSRKSEWVVYAKRPFGGPEAVLAYLSRYTHRVAIANRRLIAANVDTVSFRYKDYRRDGPDRYQVMTLKTGEFIRRFLVHVLPKGFHRIRHYGLFAKPACADNIARARQLLAVSQAQGKRVDADAANDNEPINRCPCCGGRMIIIERFNRGATPRYQPSAPVIAARLDTS
jgi:hypothetical protein